MKGRQIRSTSDRLFTSLIVFTVICNLKVFTVKCLEAVFLQLLCKKKRIICKKKMLTNHFFTIAASKCKGPWANHMCFGGSWLKALCYTIEDYLVIYNCVITNNQRQKKNEHYSYLHAMVEYNLIAGVYKIQYSIEIILILILRSLSVIFFFL